MQGTPVIQWFIGLTILCMVAISLPKRDGYLLMGIVLLSFLVTHPQLFKHLARDIQNLGGGIQGI